MPALGGGMTAGDPRPLRIGLSARLMHRPPQELNFPVKTLQYLEQSIAHWVMAHGALAFMVPTIERGRFQGKWAEIGRLPELKDAFTAAS